MNAAPYTHLIWKEYRAIRGFWIALIALAVFMQLLVLAFAQDRGWATEFVYNIALATPVFFAIGCIGTAYAIEKEDGTFEWLRSSPASDAQLFISKVGLCLVATVAMFAILWFVTQTLFVAPPNQADVLRGMLGLWLLAGLEALAWGLLFSLLSARPLMAIVLALFATSTAVHVLSWIAQPYQPDRFEYSRYVTAIPQRLGLLAMVAAADVYLGLRWLGSEERTSLLSPREKEDASARRPATKADISALLRHRDRATILGRLTWQHLRQSGRTMFTLAALQVLLCLLAANYGLVENQQSVLPIVPLLAFAALMGANVFQADQQRAQFRFFVEHNVPPRYVWLSRLVPWILVATVSTLISVIIWLGTHTLFELSELAGLLVRAIAEPWKANEDRWNWHDYPALRYMLPAVLLSLLTIPAFTAGQWVSMFVRSGLLSGFFSLLLAGVLAGWSIAVFAGGLSWFVFLVPIPFMLLWATWLRAPDWILERTIWKARSKAAAAVLAPAAMLLIAAPIARVEQVSVTSPGFDPAAYVAEITPAALETGEIYRQANAFYSPISISENEHYSYRQLNRRASDHVSRNRESLDLILKASQRHSNALANPKTLTDWPVVNDERLVSLVAASAYDLEGNGESETALADSLHLYFTAFTVERQLSSFAPELTVDMPHVPLATLKLLAQWGGRPAQTEANLHSAIDRLQQLDTSILGWEDALRSNYILCERLLAGDDRVAAIFYGRKGSVPLSQDLLALRLLPWERIRERRSLNEATRDSLELLKLVRAKFAGGDYAAELATPYYPHIASSSPLHRSPATYMQRWARDAAIAEVSFETSRRATLITLGCLAYRLEHGELPTELSRLQETGILEAVPNDPMSGRPFVYFPQGIPAPRTGTEQYILDRRVSFAHWQRLNNHELEPEVPCLWSPGLLLSTVVIRRVADDPQAETPNQAEKVSEREDVYYVNRDWGIHTRQLPDYQAWLQGEWFPIPAEK